MSDSTALAYALSALAAGALALGTVLALVGVAQLVERFLHRGEL